MNHTIVVLGTGTDVGKTTASSALISCALNTGKNALSVKPIQTGTLSYPSDQLTVHRLTGCTAVTLYEYPEALAPNIAARLTHSVAPTVSNLTQKLQDFSASNHYNYLVVEAAGGLLVRINDIGEDFVQLCSALAAHPVLVTTAELGTLNYTELAVNHLRTVGYPTVDVIIAGWPNAPQLVHSVNAVEIAAFPGVELCGVLPADMLSLHQKQFSGTALSSISHQYYGNWRSTNFLAQQNQILINYSQSHQSK